MVTFESSQSPGVEVMMSDSGTGGDAVAGDAVYTISLPTAPVLAGLRADDVNRFFLGYARPYSGSTAAPRYNIFVDVADATIPDVPVRADAPDVQHTDYVVNIKMPEAFPTSSSPTIIPGPSVVTRRFYELFPDNFDFVNVVYEPGYFQNRHHITVRNSVQGIGQPFLNSGSVYGSAARLLGINVFPAKTFFDMAEPGAQHETGHQWINFLNVAPLASGIPHWPLSSMASGIMGFSIPPTGQGGEFQCVIVPDGSGIRLARRTDQPVFNDLDLYLMGLLPADAVSEQIVLDNQDISSVIAQCNGAIYSGTFKRFRVSDLISNPAIGPRIPDVTASQKIFRTAVVIVSRDALLSPAAMSLYSFFAQRGELQTPVPFHAGFTKGITQPFALSTRGLATMSTNFTTQFSLTTTVSPGGSGAITTNPATADGRYNPGTTVQLTAAANPGNAFSFWTGDLTGAANPQSLVMSSSKTVTANFTSTSGLRFVPVFPCRVADTRNPIGPLGGPVIEGNTTRNFDIPASGCGIPSTALAYALNVTVVPAARSLGYLTIWPAGQSQPLVSTLNSLDGRIKANAATVVAGTSGAVSLFATDATHVILDVSGYFADPASAPTGLVFYPVTPCRVADTRNPDGPLGGPILTGGSIRTFPILSSPCGLPDSAAAYSLNMTVVPSGGLSYLTTWPSGTPQPLASTLNDLTGTIVANAAIVPKGTSGSIDVFVTEQTHVVIDVNGYFAPPAAGGLLFYALTPCRVIDTRNASGPFGGPALSGSRTFDIGAGPCAVPPTAKAYSLNATVVPAGPLGFVTLWPAGQPQPLVSTMNSPDAAIASNAAILPASGGSISAFSSHATHLILDLNGFFAP